MSSEIGMRTIALVDDLKDKLGDGDYLALMNALRDDRQEFEQELHYAFQSVAVSERNNKSLTNALKESDAAEKTLRNTINVLNDTIIALTVQHRTTVLRLTEDVRELGGNPERSVANLNHYASPPESSGSSVYALGTKVAKKYGKRHLTGEIIATDGLLGKCTIRWDNTKQTTHANKFIDRYIRNYTSVFGAEPAHRPFSAITPEAVSA